MGGEHLEGRSAVYDLPNGNCVVMAHKTTSPDWSLVKRLGGGYRCNAKTWIKRMHGLRLQKCGRCVPTSKFARYYCRAEALLMQACKRRLSADAVGKSYPAVEESSHAVEESSHGGPFLRLAAPSKIDAT